jgi:hypothetical protein
MKIEALKRSGTRRPVYTGVVSDEDGGKDFELSITGSKKLVETIFSKSDFDIEIAQHVTENQFEERSRRFWNSRVERRDAVSPTPESVTALVGQKTPAVSASKDTVVVYLRRTKGDGTFWAMWFPGIVLPPGASVLFVLPRVWTTWSVVVPVAGNPNLFLTLLPPPAPVVDSGLFGGLSIDTVSFTTAPFPWTQFTAWHLILGAAPTPTITSFGMTGHSITLF